MPVFDDDRELVGERGIVRDAVGYRIRQDVAVAVLMLQPFAGERRPPRRAAEQEPAAARVGGGPDEVADTLEAEHRVVDEKRDRVDAVDRVRGAGRDEGCERARLVDPLFENLAVGRLLVVQERIHIDGLVELSDVGVDADLPEERFHAERARFIGHDRARPSCRGLDRAAASTEGGQRPSSSMRRGLRYPF